MRNPYDDEGGYAYAQPDSSGMVDTGRGQGVDAPLDGEQIGTDAQTMAAPTLVAGGQQPIAPTQPSGPGTLSAPGAGGIPTGPPGFKPKFDKKKLADVKTPADLVDAMTSSSRTDYMSWWEKQHGSINAKFNQVMQTIGHKPDPERKWSKQDMFTYLLEFGLGMMRGRGADPQQRAGAAIATGISAVDTGRATEGRQYDTRVQAATAQRDAELKGLGTQADALKTQSELDRNAAATLESGVKAYGEAGKALTTPAPHTLNSPTGVRQWDAKAGRWVTATDETGKPIMPMPTLSGGAGGRGAGGAHITDYDKRMAEYKLGHPEPNPKDAAASAQWHVAALEYVTGRMLPKDKITQSSYIQAVHEMPPKEFNGTTEQYTAAVDARAREIATAIRAQQPQVATGDPLDPLGIRHKDPLSLRGGPILR